MKNLPTTICPKCNGTGQVINNELLGSKYRSYREQNNITLRKFAYQMDISVQYLSDLERGRRNWNTKQIKLFEQNTFSSNTCCIFTMHYWLKSLLIQAFPKRESGENPGQSPLL